jgi:CRISPR-associated exonuclease Cas4
VLAAKNDLATDTQVTYSDDDKSAQLLVDERTGLRGRPDQIVIIDGELIPVEQKTGKVPEKPHRSHTVQVLAYAALVDSTTGKTPPYCILRYGQENLHKVAWDEANRTLLFDAVKSVQQTMANGGAARDHDRPGKCRHCSRRYACEDSLV